MMNKGFVPYGFCFILLSFILNLFANGLSLATENREIILSEENSGIELQFWCEEKGGQWVETVCGWSEVEMNQQQEETLNQECRDRAGVWQTLTEGIYGPSSCGGEICTLDSVLIDYSLTGVGCVWYPDIQSPR